MIMEFENLGFSYSKHLPPLFDNISCLLKDGEIFNILGVNGAGKTTFAKCLLNILSNYRGDITIDGCNLKELSIKERAKYLGYIGVGDVFSNQLTVIEYILLGSAPHLNFFDVPTSSQEKQALDILNRMGCSHLYNKKVYQLSQGEQQLISISRILMQNPCIIVFDEPTASLDLGNQRRLLQLIKRLQSDGHIIVNITHNPNHAFSLGGYALLLMKSEHILGFVDEVMTEENLSRLYNTSIRVVNDKVVGKIAISY